MQLPRAFYGSLLYTLLLGAGAFGQDSYEVKLLGRLGDSVLGASYGSAEESRLFLWEPDLQSVMMLDSPAVPGIPVKVYDGSNIDFVAVSSRDSDSQLLRHFILRDGLITELLPREGAASIAPLLVVPDERALLCYRRSRLSVTPGTANDPVLSGLVLCSGDDLQDRRLLLSTEAVFSAALTGSGRCFVVSTGTEMVLVSRDGTKLGTSPLLGIGQNVKASGEHSVIVTARITTHEKQCAPLWYGQLATVVEDGEDVGLRIDSCFLFPPGYSYKYEKGVLCHFIDHDGDRQLALARYENGVLTKETAVPTSLQPEEVVLLKDGKALAVSNGKGTVEVWSILGTQLQRSAVHRIKIKASNDLVLEVSPG